VIGKDSDRIHRTMRQEGTRGLWRLWETWPENDRERLRLWSVWQQSFVFASDVERRALQKQIDLEVRNQRAEREAEKRNDPK
jgi:hypothetical protein